MRSFTFLLICILLVEATCSTDWPFHETIKNESYGPDVRHKMDFYLPAHRDSNTEVVILIHGGAWVAGDKSDFSNSDFTNRLLQSGFAVASINYRYACGDYHKQMDDIEMAIRHIMSRANSRNIADSSFGLLGGSAGGHLALLYSHSFDSLGVVKAVVSIAGPTDLTDTLFRYYAANYKIEYVFEQLLGATLQENPQLYRDASPLFNSRNVPSLFIHGKRDDLVPCGQSVRMYHTMAALGIAADTILFENAGHNVLGDDNENLEKVLKGTTNWMLLHLDKK